MSRKVLPDDGRDLDPELAEAIAALSEGNAALIVLSGQIIAKLSRQEKLRFLAGGMTVIHKPTRTRTPVTK